MREKSPTVRAPRRVRALVHFAIALASIASGQPSPSAQVLPSDLIVSSFLSDAIVRYDRQTGALIDIFAQSEALVGPGGLAFGSDGGLYVAGQGSHNVVRFDSETGEFIDEFVPAGSGGLSFPTSLVFGPDGHLYVASLGTQQVLRYHGVTGVFIDAFVTAGSGGLDKPIDVAFGPDGHLYVTGSASHNVLRYDGVTGAFLGVFASGGGLNGPAGLTFGPDGHLYVASGGTSSVLRYDGVTGAFLDAFVPAASGGLSSPIGLLFGPDGNLYVASGLTNGVLRYDGATGAFLDVFVTAGSEGLSLPTFLAVRPSPGVIFFDAGEGTKGSLVFGDFNGDGFDDLAMGSFQQNVGSVPRAGAVTVVYGTAEGLRSTGSQTWHEDSPGIGGTSGSRNQFGRALAAGDFDGDGIDDLAIGIPGAEFAFATDAGAVVVLHGSPRISENAPGGLQTAVGRPSQRWTQFSLSGSGSDESEDRFGAALVAANFNGDVNSLTGLPMDDLAIGVPGEDDGAGAVRVISGSRIGLIATGAEVWSQGTPGIEGNYEDDDRFGAALAAGNFDGDRNPLTGRGLDDLAVGVPGEDTGIFFGADAGAVNIIRGSLAGLTVENNRTWTQDSAGIQESADRDDEFGSSLASGDFNGDGRDDLAIGVPSEDYGTSFGPNSLPSRVDRGVVNVIYGTSTGLDSEDDQLLLESELRFPQRGDRFGFALAAGDFDRDGLDDLAIGVPGIGDPTIFTLLGTDEGDVRIYAGRSGRQGLQAVAVLEQDGPVLGSPEDGDDFGSALAAGDAGDPAGNQGISDLAVFVNDGDYGAANVIYGGPAGLTAEGNQQWFCGEDGVAGINEHITAGTLFDVIIDGRFTNEPGQGEWSDVTVAGFISDPANPQVVQATESDDSSVNSLLLAVLSPDAGGAASAEVDLAVMLAYLPKTSATFLPGESMADITLPLALEGSAASRPVTLRVRAASVAGLASGIASVAVLSQFEAVVDLDGDGLPDVPASDLGIEVGANFGPSPLSPVPHLLVELRVPLRIEAGFASPGGPLPPGGTSGVYSPAPGFWTAAFARDDQPPGVLTPASGALVRVHPNGSVTLDAGLVPELVVAVDVRPDENVNTINLGSQAAVPVAILTTPLFDATTLSSDEFEWHNPEDLTRVARPGAASTADVDRDGDRDRVFLFRVRDLIAAGVLDCSTTAAAFVGRTLSDRMVAGADSIAITGCPR